MSTINQAESTTMSDGKVSGAEFRRRREALGGDMTIAAMALFARVGQGVVDRWERGVIDAPRDPNYWQLMEVLERLERGEMLVLTAKRTTSRGGGVIVALQTSGDREQMHQALDEIAREDG